MESLLAVFRTTTNILNISLAELPDDVARVRTRGSDGPSISWTIGHLLDSRVKSWHSLAIHALTRIPNNLAIRLQPMARTTPTLGAMLSEWKSLHDALEHAFAQSENSMSAPLANAGIHGESKVRDRRCISRVA